VNVARKRVVGNDMEERDLGGKGTGGWPKPETESGGVTPRGGLFGGGGGGVGGGVVGEGGGGGGGVGWGGSTGARCETGAPRRSERNG